VPPYPLPIPNRRLVDTDLLRKVALQYPPHLRVADGRDIAAEGRPRFISTNGRFELKRR
jgi:hypothetical protein